MPSNLLRGIPSVSDLLESPPLKNLVSRFNQHAAMTRVRAILDEVRMEVQAAASEATLPSVTELAERIARRIREDDERRLRPVINATGVLLHPGLGRAVLAEAAIEELVAISRDYASLELDPASGDRAARGSSAEALLRELSGAEAALVVNSAASAMFLTLAAVAAGRQVLVSRGQVGEIEVGYRLPEIIRQSGALLCEVGTVNHTGLNDFEQAIGDQTAALLVVEPGSFQIAGFTQSPSLDSVTRLGHQRQKLVIHDLGLGGLIDFTSVGLTGIPVANDSIRAGADLVLVSGDKLLGGPECGIILGRRNVIQRICGHPLARAVQADKLTLAALAATLKLYQQPEVARREIPVLRFLNTPSDNLKLRAHRLADQMAQSPVISSAVALQDVAYLAEGTIPSQQIATWCVGLEPKQMTVDKLSGLLRSGQPSVIARVQNGRLMLDLRTVMPRQDQDLVRSVAALAAGRSEQEN